MLLDLRSLVEQDQQPATNPHLIGTRGRRLKPPYTDAPGKPQAPRHFHQTAGKGWKRLTGTRSVAVQAAAVVHAGAGVQVTVRLQPRPQVAVPATTAEATAVIVLQQRSVRQLREAPRPSTGRKQVLVKALAEGHGGSGTRATARRGRPGIEDEEMLLEL